MVGKLKDLIARAPSPTEATQPEVKPKKKKVVSSLYLDPPAHRHIRDVAHARDVKPHDIFMEAINEWLERNGYDTLDQVVEKERSRAGEGK